MNSKILICTSSNGFYGGSEKTLFNFLSNTSLDIKNWALVIPKKQLKDFDRVFNKLGLKKFEINLSKNRNTSKKIFINFLYLLQSFILKIFYFFKILKIIKNYNPDILYLNNVYCEPEALVGKILRKRIIWHIKGMGEPENLITYIRNFFIKDFSDIIITLNAYDKKIIIGDRYKKKYNKKIFIIPEGLDFKDYEYNSLIEKNFCDDIKILKKEGKIIIGFASAITQNKGIDFFTALAKKMIELDKNLIFLHVGKKYKDRDKLFFKNILNKNKDILNKYLFFKDYTKNINAFFKLIDIFFFPSRVEGQSIAIMEAMFFKKIIVASDIDANKSLIEDNNTGLLYKTDNLIDATNKLKFLLNNKNIWKTFGNNAYQEVVNKYSLQQSINNLENQFRRLMK